MILEQLTGILVPIALFLCCFGVVYLFLTNQYRERMAMLERGMDPRLGAVGNRHHSLKFGLVAVGIAIGLVLANVLETTLKLQSEVIYPAMILLFGGLGLLLHYRILSKRMR